MRNHIKLTHNVEGEVFPTSARNNFNIQKIYSYITPKSAPQSNIELCFLRVLIL